MIIRHPNRRPTIRKGATLVESAIVYSVLFLLVFGIVIGATAVFRFQQVAHMAREGSRWASTHGRAYEIENYAKGARAATADEIRVRAAQAGGVDPSEITCSVSWDTDNRPYHVEIRDDQVVAVTNNVSVTVEYRWDPGFLLGPFTLRSTSVSMMHY